MSDTDLTAGTAYYNTVSGVNPDGTYEITNVQLVGTGNDPPCRKITIETVEAPHKPDKVYAICWKDNATHNPATQCPLTSVSFCVESKRHDDSDPTNTLTDAVVFVVRQNNRIYATASQSVGVNWKRASGSYVQNQFTEIDGAGNPDFTATGTVIEFGFALKLQVNQDEDPYDVVMFDNLCVTRSVDCGVLCSTSNCDVYNGGDSMNVLSSTTGASGATATYSLSSTVGNPAGSHKFTFAGSGVSGNVASVTVEVSADVFNSSSGNCLNPTQLTMCAEVMTPDVPYFSHTFALILRQGSITQTIYTTGAAYSINVWRKIVDTTRSVSSSFDFSQPVQLVLTYSGTPSSVTGETIHYIDNICVKAVYGNFCRQSGSVALDLTGISVVDNGCNNAAAAEFINDTLSSTIVLNWQSVYSSLNYCGYVYLSPVFGTGSLALGTRCTWWISVFLTVRSNVVFLQIRTTAFNAICNGNLNFTYSGAYSDFCNGGTLTPLTSEFEGSALCPCISLSGFSGSSATWEPL